MSTQPTPSHDSPQDPQHHPQRGPQPPAVVLESASVHVDEAGETPGALVRR